MCMIPSITLIMPVYKVEKYLKRSIDSILDQSYRNFELLLIDDGSPDRSGEICDEYAKNDSRIKVFHKANGGVSSARNLGLDNASGEWIAFVDSDDYVEKNYLDSIMVAEADIDLLHFGFTKETPGNKIYISNFFPDNKRILLEDLFSRDVFSSCSVTYFYRRKLIGDIRFNENLKYSEDREFIIKVALRSENYILLTPNIAYRYTYNPSSATNTKRTASHYLDDLVGLYNIATFVECNNIKLSSSVKMFIYNIFMKSFFIVVSIIGRDWKNEKKIAQIIIQNINEILDISNLESRIFCSIPNLLIIKYRIYWRIRTFYYKYIRCK